MRRRIAGLCRRRTIAKERRGRCHNCVSRLPNAFSADYAKYGDVASHQLASMFLENRQTLEELGIRNLQTVMPVTKLHRARADGADRVVDLRVTTGCRCGSAGFFLV